MSGFPLNRNVAFQPFINVPIPWWLRSFRGLGIARTLNTSRVGVSPAQLPLTCGGFARLGRGRKRGTWALATLRSRLPACVPHRGVQVLLHDLARLLRAGLAVLGAYGQAPVRAGGRARGAAAVALRLQCLRNLQGVAQALVPDHGALVDFRELVVAATSQGHAVG